MTKSKLSVFLMLLSACIEGRVCAGGFSALLNGTRDEQNVLYNTVRYGHYIELDCGSDDESEWIHNWKKWDKSTERWETYTPDRTDIILYDNKAVLSIQSSIYEDEGLYQCSVRKGTFVKKVIQFQINVLACDKLARGPFPVSPLPCKETTVHERDILTLPCAGYFGCPEEGDIRIVTWFVSHDKNNTDDWVEAASLDKRYTQTDFQRDSGVVVGSNLTIVGVSDVDLNRKFMCLLASPQEVQGQTKIVVTLRKSDSSISTAAFDFLDVVAIVSVVAFISLILNVAMFVITIHQRCQKADKNPNRTLHEKTLMPVKYCGITTV